MPAPRNHRYDGPAAPLTYSQHYGREHSLVVNDETPDDTFHSKMNNKQKVEYVCRTLGLPPAAFFVDVPFPLEDWVVSDNMSLMISGLYVNYLRVRFYGMLIGEELVPESSPAWIEHAKAEFWRYAFNSALSKRQTGILLDDMRVLN